MFSLICAWINGSINNHEAGDLISHHPHYNVTVFSDFMGCLLDPKQAMERKCLKILMTHTTLTFDIENGAWHIVHSWVVLVPHMKQFVSHQAMKWTQQKNQMTTVTLTFGLFYSERLQGAGFRSVNPAERWRENPARALARAGCLQHLECGIHRSESSPEGSFALIPHPVAKWAKTTP